MQIMSQGQASPCYPETFEMVRELAAVHTGPGKPVQLLDHDPVAYRAQRAYYMPGKLQDLDTIFALGKVIEPRFKDGVEELREDETVKEIGARLDAGENVASNMNHTNIPDTGAAYAQLFSALKLNKHNFSTALIGSSTLTFMGIEFVPGFPMPVDDALSNVAENKFYTFPTSKRMMASEIAKDKQRRQTIKQHNAWFHHLFGKLLRQGSVLWVVLDNATHDEEKGGATQLAEVSMGTANLFIDHDTLAVATAVGRESEDSTLQVRYGDVRKVTTHADVHDMSREKVNMLNNMFPEKSFVYEGDK